MDIMEFAVKMELDGEKYYLELAKKYENAGLKSIFRILAEEERIHAEILKNRAKDLPYELNDTFSEMKNVFIEIRDNENIDSINSIEAADIYGMALDKERESIELYEKCYQEAGDESEKEIFKYLITQEASHYEVIEELIKLINRPKEWVESAEFGIREEY